MRKKFALWGWVCVIVLAFASCVNAMSYVGGGERTEASLKELLETRKRRYAENKPSVASALKVTGGARTAFYHEEGNSGDSEATAYILDSEEDVAELVLRVHDGLEPSGKYYKLDFDLSIDTSKGNMSWFLIGTSESPFKGHFDGNNKTIVVNIDHSANANENSGAAIFGYVATPSGTAIKNLNVTGTVKGAGAGGIVGFLDSGTVQDCVFYGTVEATDNEGIAGGIVAALNGGNVTNCRVLTDSIISASKYAGGIAGIMEAGRISNCTSHATLRDAAYKGGIVGGASSASGLSNNTYTGATQEVGYIESKSNGRSGDTNRNRSSSSGGGGCDVGLGAIGLSLCAALLLRKD